MIAEYIIYCMMQPVAASFLTWSLNRNPGLHLLLRQGRETIEKPISLFC